MNKNKKRIMLTTAEGQAIKAEKDFIIFHTNSVAPDIFSFDWVFSDSSVMTVDWGDGSSFETHATILSHSYSNSGIKTVKLSCPNPDKLKYFNSNDDNNLVGIMPSFIKFKNLEEFYIGTGSLVGNFPSFSGLSSLLVADIWENQLTGNLPSFENCPSLSQIDCDTNQLSGTIPSLESNVNLRTFYAWNNSFSDIMPGCFATQKTFIQCTLYNNLLTAQAVDSILHDFVVSLSIPDRVIMGPPPSRGVWLDGTGNSAPTITGMEDYNTLIAAGWNVQINQPEPDKHYILTVHNAGSGQTGTF